MSLFRRRSVSLLEAVREYDRPLRRAGRPYADSHTALRQSVVWAATRLRADLVSLMPIDVYDASPAAGIALKVSAPPVLVQPSEVAEGHPMGISEWMYSSQMSLDRVGNFVGLITKLDAFGLPAAIDPIPDYEVGFRIKDRRITEYRVNGEIVPSRLIWHERQHTVAGLPIGLSPIAYAALVLSGADAAQEYAVDWFVNGAVPGAILKNSEMKIDDPVKLEKIKRQFKASIGNGDVFVTGKDWTYDPVAAKAAESEFIAQMNYSDVALCRFMSVPADLVDVVAAGSSVTYANISQRNLQVMVMNLGGPVKRREENFLGVVPRPRYVKLNRDALLAMDAASRATLFDTQIKSRTRTPDQARALDDLPPLSEQDYAQFDRLWPATRPPQQLTSGGN